MKIALLSFEYPMETGFGGIGTYTWYQARGLAKLGHEVHVLAGSTSETELRTEEHDGVRVFRFRADGSLMRGFGTLDKLQVWWTKNRLENALSMYHGLKLLQKKYTYDIIEMPECGAEGLLINYLMHETTLTKFHSPAKLIMPYYDVCKADVTFCSFIEKAGMRRSKAYSSCSRFLQKEVQDKLGISSPVEVIPNGIDLELFERLDHVDIFKQYNIPKERVTIFFSGRMEQRKGIHLCNEIVPDILERYEVAFVFAGQDLFQYMTGTLLPNVNSRKLKGSIHYLGKLQLHEVRSCLRQTDIFLIPSLWENCPYSCLEAMSAGRAIVSSDAGGMPELIQDNVNGLLARTGDAQSFVQCLERVVEDKGLREKLGNEARATIERSYTDIHIAEASVEYYTRCIRESA
ncbi:MAG: glycosyltransferase family 4 protein [Candidatus Electrothrix sp.]